MSRRRGVDESDPEQVALHVNDIAGGDAGRTQGGDELVSSKLPHANLR